MTEVELIQFAESNFPRAPEKLAEHLEVEVEYDSFGCDGWCIQVDDRSTITISNRFPETRQRFTLAHELGHLVLGIPSVVGETIYEFYQTNNEEELRVNTLAAQLLLPVSIIKQLVHEIPVTPQTIKRVAKNANVSELFVVRRLASVSSKIGLLLGVAIFYKKGSIDWHTPRMPWLTRKFAQDLYNDCVASPSKVIKIHREQQKDVLFASILENPHLDITTIFLQLVEEHIGLKKSSEEIGKELESILLEGKSEFRFSLQGCLSSMKSRVNNMTLEEALSLFEVRYLQGSDRWDEEFKARLRSDQGQEYIKLRLKPWIRR